MLLIERWEVEDQLLFEPPVGRDCGPEPALTASQLQPTSQCGGGHEDRHGSVPDSAETPHGFQHSGTIYFRNIDPLTREITPTKVNCHCSITTFSSWRATFYCVQFIIFLDLSPICWVGGDIVWGLTVYMKVSGKAGGFITYVKIKIRIKVKCCVLILIWLIFHLFS